jgi:hypothetical protein
VQRNSAVRVQTGYGPHLFGVVDHDLCPQMPHEVHVPWATHGSDVAASGPSQLHCEAAHGARRTDDENAVTCGDWPAHAQAMQRGGAADGHLSGHHPQQGVQGG